MKEILIALQVFSLLLLVTLSCNEKKDNLSKQVIGELDLKRGEIISCGTADKEFGTAIFETSCSEKIKEDFNLAVKLLHSFEYDEAEKMFSKIIDEQPDCAMAYWGIAMSNFHPLWTPPSEPELKKGAKAVGIAQSITQKSKKEESYINSIAAFYKDWDKTDHRTRTINFENAMEKLYKEYPDDKEAAIFYALAINAAVDPADKSFTRQKKAGSILNNLYPGQPNHPGIVHYIIHNYDYPEIAEMGLSAARKYAAVAPSSAHALHMPSHIYTRLGLWDDCISSNLASVSAAKCYAEQAGIKGHWDEELHALDYLMYAYLQKGDNDLAKKQWDYLKTINYVSPLNFKVAYSFAAIPSRYVLENKLWKEAQNIDIHYKDFSWEKFQWQKAIIHFTRLIGAVNNGNLSAANSELNELKNIHNNLLQQKDSYKANQVQIQIKSSEAWIKVKEKKHDEALALMKLAADMEDKTEKHPVTPGEVLPARELLGDMLLQMNKPADALIAYEANLKNHPKRFNGLYGAGLAAEKLGNLEKAEFYYSQLNAPAKSSNSVRPEMNAVRLFFEKNKKLTASRT